MGSALIASLSRLAPLEDEDIAAIRDLELKNTRSAGAGEQLVREGDRVSTFRMISSGWAYRQKFLSDGRRQISFVMVPGDFDSYNPFVLLQEDHALCTPTGAEVVELSQDQCENLFARHPQITQAVRVGSLINASIQSEHAVTLGRRTARERIGHVFCELFCRLEAVGLAIGTRVPLPLNQTELGDLCGLTNVHVNRNVQDMRHEGLIKLDRHYLTIRNLDGLAAASGFAPRLSTRAVPMAGKRGGRSVTAGLLGGGLRRTAGRPFGG